MKPRTPIPSEQRPRVSHAKVLEMWKPELGRKCPTLKQIGDAVGCTKERVRQILALHGASKPRRIDWNVIAAPTRPPKRDIDRVFDKVEERGQHMIWRGYINPTSGVPDLGGKYPRHVIWEHFRGPIPPTEFLCRMCDEPLCINPNGNDWLDAPNTDRSERTP